MILYVNGASIYFFRDYGARAVPGARAAHVAGRLRVQSDESGRSGGVVRPGSLVSPTNCTVNL